MLMARQRGLARRTVAIALFVLIPVIFGVLALLSFRYEPKDAPLVAPKPTLTLMELMTKKQVSGDHVTPPTSRA